jgi:hypothetical protein
VRSARRWATSRPANEIVRLRGPHAGSIEEESRTRSSAGRGNADAEDGRASMIGRPYACYDPDNGEIGDICKFSRLPGDRARS